MDRTVAPKIHPIKPFDLVQPHTSTFANGLRWHHIQAGVQPVVAIQFIFKAGAWYAPSKAAATLTTRMLNEGTKHRTSEQIAAQIDQFGAFIDISAGTDYAIIELYCLTKHLQPMMALLKDLVTEATFPEKELQKVKNLLAQNIRINNEKNANVASSTFKATLIGEEHPYGADTTAEQIENTPLATLVQFFQTNYQHQPFQVITAGNLSDKDHEHLYQDLAHFAIQPTTIRTSQPFDIQAIDNKIYIEKADAVQTSVRVGKPMLNRKHPDYSAFRVLNTVVGGYFGSRLMANIREEKGYTYGIHSSVMAHYNAAYWVVSTDVKKEAREHTIEEIFKEIELLKRHKVPQEELKMVKNYLKGSFVNNLNTPFAIAEHYRNIFMYDLPADYYQNYIDQVESVTATRLQELANKYLSGEYLVVMVG
jgi:zinc protease